MNCVNAPNPMKPSLLICMVVIFPMFLIWLPSVSSAQAYKDLYDAKWKYIGTSRGDKIFINTLRLRRYGLYTYYDMLINRKVYQRYQSVVRFHEVDCQNSVIRTFQFITCSGKNGTGYCENWDENDGRARSKLVVRILASSKLKTIDGRAFTHACKNAGSNERNR